MACMKGGEAYVGIGDALLALRLEYNSDSSAVRDITR